VDAIIAKGGAFFYKDGIEKGEVVLEKQEWAILGDVFNISARMRGRFFE
jgi:hypothetical protein